MGISERDINICRMYIKGVLVKDIAERVGVSVNTIYKVLADNEVELRLEKRRRYKREIIENICRMFDAGYGVRQIEDNLGVSRELVIRVLKTFREEGYADYLKMCRVEKDRRQKKQRIEESKKAVKEGVKKQVNEGVYYLVPLSCGENVLITMIEPASEIIENSLYSIDFSKLGEDIGELKKLIAFEVYRGASFYDIVERYGVDYQVLIGMYEGMNERPKYLGNRPPLKLD